MCSVCPPTVSKEPMPRPKLVAVAVVVLAALLSPRLQRRLTRKEVLLIVRSVPQSLDISFIHSQKYITVARNISKLSHRQELRIICSYLLLKLPDPCHVMWGWGQEWATTPTHPPIDAVFPDEVDVLGHYMITVTLLFAVFP